MGGPTFDESQCPLLALSGHEFTISLLLKPLVQVCLAKSSYLVR